MTKKTQIKTSFPRFQHILFKWKTASTGSSWLLFKKMEENGFHQAKNQFLLVKIWSVSKNCLPSILMTVFTYSRVSNRKGGRNKRGGWQILAKIINGDAGKNKAIRNFVEINHQTILWKYQQKEQKYKGSLCT